MLFWWVELSQQIGKAGSGLISRSSRSAYEFLSFSCLVYRYGKCSLYSNDIV